jgi:hypothetical protein
VLGELAEEFCLAGQYEGDQDAGGRGGQGRVQACRAVFHGKADTVPAARF